MDEHVSHPEASTERGREKPYQHGQRKWAIQGSASARNTTLISICAIVVLVAMGLVSIVVRAHETPSPKVAYPAIDRIPCQSTDQTGTHIHVHLTIYIDDKRIPIPEGIGIAPDGSCLYWLHTHDASGIIHIEAPAGSSFTLGNFLDIWREQFRQRGYPSQLNAPAGWKTYVGGRRLTSGMLPIPLQRHTLITLIYNSPGVIPDTSYRWGDY
jgi:hypothetical protein